MFPTAFAPLISVKNKLSEPPRNYHARLSNKLIFVSVDGPIKSVLLSENFWTGEGRTDLEHIHLLISYDWLTVMQWPLIQIVTFSITAPFHLPRVKANV
jgi:hypothetical protein